MLRLSPDYLAGIDNDVVKADECAELWPLSTNIGALNFVGPRRVEIFISALPGRLTMTGIITTSSLTHSSAAMAEGKHTKIGISRVGIFYKTACLCGLLIVVKRSVNGVGGCGSGITSR
jgi:hypothetical protein